MFFGKAGTILLIRRDKTAALPDDAADRLARLEATVPTTQDLVLAQEERKEINEERDFLRQLHPEMPALLRPSEVDR